MKKSICICCVFLLILLSQAGYAKTAKEIAKIAFDSTVVIFMEKANGQVSQGSGFFVRNDQIATNLHVIEGAVKGYAKLIGQTAKYNIEGIIGVDPTNDLAILKISGKSSRSLTLGDSNTIQVGESIYAVGNPEGLEGTFSQGIVSSIRREIGSGKYFQMTAPISPGSSGGPVMNTQGEVIGVSTASHKSGQNLNLAVPSIHLKVLLQKNGPVKPLIQAGSAKYLTQTTTAMPQTLYDNALTAFRNRQYQQAQSIWEQFVLTYPNDALVPQAWFWQGESLYQQKYFEEAIMRYQVVLEKYPASPKYPAALLKQAASFMRIGKDKAGRVLLYDLISRYPDLLEAQQARALLSRW